jgi:hypothetical protein
MTDRLRVGDAKRDVAIGEVTALLGVVEEAAFALIQRRLTSPGVLQVRAEDLARMQARLGA